MDTITGAGVHRLCAAGRLMMRRFPPIKLSLGFLMFGETNRLVIVRRIELGSVDSPSRVFEYAIDLADAGRWQSQGNHLADTHGDIPAHHLDTGRRKRFVGRMRQRTAMFVHADSVCHNLMPAFAFINSRVAMAATLASSSPNLAARPFSRARGSRTLTLRLYL